MVGLALVVVAGFAAYDQLLHPSLVAAQQLPQITIIGCQAITEQFPNAFRAAQGANHGKLVGLDQLIAYIRQGSGLEVTTLRQLDWPSVKEFFGDVVCAFYLN